MLYIYRVNNVRITVKLLHILMGSTLQQSCSRQVAVPKTIVLLVFHFQNIDIFESALQTLPQRRGIELFLFLLFPPLPEIVGKIWVSG